MGSEHANHILRPSSEAQGKSPILDGLG